MMTTPRLPIGIEQFKIIREGNYYYVDKTALIKSLLSRQFAAHLITRPRRFGKTLTMSMLADFFDISLDSKAHFDGLEISHDHALCESWMNQYPVLYLTLKSVEGTNYASAYGSFIVLLSDLCKRYAFLENSVKVDEDDRLLFRELKAQKSESPNMKNSLLLLTRMLNAHYGKPVILLVDEYDVPLAKASEYGYYAEMLDIIRALLGNAIKTNDYLKLAVITGCLRISKESIFTGVNNLVTDSISGSGFEEYIGFTESDVTALLKSTGFSDHAHEIKSWYDGYCFGRTDIYCPWSVLNHLNALRDNPSAVPQNYWANTSHNGIIYNFIDRKLLNVKGSFEILMAGGSISTQIAETLTYDYLTSSVKNFWSLLYLTGYLTKSDPSRVHTKASSEIGMISLRIPNEEIRSIFKTAIIDWFDDYMSVKYDRTELFQALWNGEQEQAQKMISDLLFQTISYHDYQESFYHAFLAGLFAGDVYDVESNNEYGTGRPDLVVKDDANRRVMVLELKYARTEHDIDAKMKEALTQITERRYLNGVGSGYRKKLAYGIVFHEKDCIVSQLI